MKRGEVYWADLFPRSGSEQGRTASCDCRISRRVQSDTRMALCDCGAGLTSGKPGIGVDPPRFLFQPDRPDSRRIAWPCAIR